VHCGNGERVKEELTRYISQEWLGELKFSTLPKYYAMEYFTVYPLEYFYRDY